MITKKDRNTFILGISTYFMLKIILDYLRVNNEVSRIIVISIPLVILLLRFLKKQRS